MTTTQTTGHNFFGLAGGPADLFLIRDTFIDTEFARNIPVRQLEAVQTNGTATEFDTVAPDDPHQHFVGSGDFNGDGLSDLLINVDSSSTQQRTFLVDQMIGTAEQASDGAVPGGVLAQFQIAVRGADWIVDG